MVSIPDIEHWDTAVLQKVFDVSKDSGTSLQKLGDGLGAVEKSLSGDWMGPASETYRAEHGKVRVDVSNQHGETQRVGAIVASAIEDVQSCKNELEDARAVPESMGMEISPNGSVTDPNARKTGDGQEARKRAQIRSDAEARMKHLLAMADTVEIEVANALRAAVGDPAVAIPTDALRPPPLPASKPSAAAQPAKTAQNHTETADPNNPLTAFLPPEISGNKPNPAAGEKPPTSVTDVLLAQAQGKLDHASPDGHDADPHYTRNPLLAPIIAGDPSAVKDQQARVVAARAAVDAAQAKMDASVNKSVTDGPYNGHDLNADNPLAKALFDARHNLVEQQDILKAVSDASAEAGGPRVPTPALPDNAHVQAFPPEPGFAERAPQEFADSNRAVHDITGGLVPDFVKDAHTFSHFGDATPADRAQAIADAAGMVPLPGAKLGAEGLEHLAGPGADALLHGAAPITGHELADHGGSGHAADVPPPTQHHELAASGNHAETGAQHDGHAVDNGDLVGHTGVHHQMPTYSSLPEYTQQALDRAADNSALRQDLLNHGVPPEIAHSASHDPYSNMTPQDVINNHYTPGGGPNWPLHDGFLNGRWETLDHIPPDSHLDRIGEVSGTRGDFMGTQGDSYPSRALAPGSSGDYNVFQGTGKPLPDGWELHFGKVAPEFGQPGGGTQWVVIDTDAGKSVLVDTLLRGGYLRRVGN